jgi:hypothetical protein
MRAHESFAGDAPLTVGQFRFYFAADLWEWSAEVARIHGYPAVDMTPTSEQVMSHKHPDDLAKMAVTIEHLRRSHGSLNTRHRIIDVQGDTHEVAIVGLELCDGGGVVIGTQGFYVDVTPSSTPVDDDERERNLMITEAVAEISERRGVIDQVKGMLMLIYRIDDQHAFELLRWRSQLANTKLRALAHQLREDIAMIDYDETLPTRSVFDQLLLTTHERIKPDPAS